MLAVAAVLAPLDVHRAAVVLLDRHRVARELLDLGVGEREAVAVGGLDVALRRPTCAAFASLVNTILIALAPRPRRRIAGWPAARQGLET